jgi:hypothetical protein
MQVFYVFVSMMLPEDMWGLVDILRIYQQDIYHHTDKHIEYLHYSNTSCIYVSYAPEDGQASPKNVEY